MFGLPGDNAKVIRKDLAESINLGFMHISPYTLIMEERTKLSLLQEQGAFTPLDDEAEATLYRFIQHFLTRYGFHQYEVSNFALKGYESIHNLTYWNNQPYVGLGASASYYLDGVRYTNERHLTRYTKAIESMQMTYFEQTTLTEDQMMEEEMMLGLRKVEGVSLDAFNKSIKSHSLYVSRLRKSWDEKLLVIKKGFIRIPAKNLYISNAILLNFI
jgi:oxygen-independent coproporphyrinogen-3 oxidase